MLTYNFKALQEVGWAAVVAGVTYAAGVIGAGVDPGDWRIWLPALAAGAGRAALAALAAKLSTSGGFSAS
jgi:hypothetical protein